MARTCDELNTSLNDGMPNALRAPPRTIESNWR
jgi:hypothetical protein